MQNAKDTFYQELRARLGAVNPERTVVVRGVTRPAVVVDENETESVASLPDCFHLSWGEVTVVNEGPMPLVSCVCEVRYGTSGTAVNGGMDRGRVLAAMDWELLMSVGQWPQNAVKQDFSALAHGGSVEAMSTRVWWSDVVLGTVKQVADRISRSATVQVMSFVEAGER